eukprot:11674107-Heterocapsa_arctica.AAC.1
MSHVRRAKYVLLFMLILSAVYPLFNQHCFSPVDNIDDIKDRYAIGLIPGGGRSARFALPCLAVITV